MLYNRGLIDWLIQRVTAIILAAYVGILVIMWAIMPKQIIWWHATLTSPAMKVLGILTSVCLTLHAAIGTWVVATDYISPWLLRRWITLISYVWVMFSALWFVYLCV
ncbi:MAG: succinate dehydrogenase, hydrophobic membrane anchor protein [Pseudomonadota bacterium]|nr:succinate dehydrogenase, hydrophobic membrane anchor protein [Pseudomonadota bacterium]